MKRVLTFLIVVLILFTSCSYEQENIRTEKVKPVKIMEIQEAKRPIILDYIGVVESDEVKRIAFKSSGTIEQIFVKKGEEIKKGDTLMKLDSKDLEYSLKASKAAMEAANSIYEKAINGASEEEIKQAEANVKKSEDAYAFAKDNFNKMQQLFDEGVISQNDLDKTKLELDIRESDLVAAKELENQVKNSVREEDKRTLLHQKEQAKADYEYKVNLIENASLVSDIDGYVVDVLYKEGEMVSAGYPVVIIRNEDQHVNVGIALNDMESVKIGDTVILMANELEVKGRVKNKSQVPNPQTRTYNIEIFLEEDVFQIGTIVEVKIIIGEEEGIWIPISSILSNGVDYVFTISNDKAVKKQIEIEKIDGVKVKVKDLSDGEFLVIEGMKKLRHEDKVIIQK